MRKCIDYVPDEVRVADTSEHTTQKIKTYKCKWQQGIEEEFSQSFSEAGIQNVNIRLHNLNSSNITQVEMDELNKDLSNFFIESAQSVGLFKEGGGHCTRGATSRGRKYPQKPWFNKACEDKRREYFKCKNNLRAGKTKAEKKRLQQILSDNFKSYKHFLSVTQAQYRVEIQSKLKSLKSANPIN